MSDLEGITRTEAHERVEKIFQEKGVQFSKRDYCSYDIPNFHLIYRDVVAMADSALKGTGFYGQEMPYAETKLKVEYLGIFHVDQ